MSIGMDGNSIVLNERSAQVKQAVGNKKSGWCAIIKHPMERKHPSFKYLRVGQLDGWIHFSNLYLVENFNTFLFTLIQNMRINKSFPQIRMPKDFFKSREILGFI